MDNGDEGFDIRAQGLSELEQEILFSGREDNSFQRAMGSNNTVFRFEELYLAF